MQNTFSQSGNDSKWFLKKSFFKIGKWHSRPPRDPPPFMANAILNFHFDYPHTSLTLTVWLKLTLWSIRFTAWKKCQPVNMKLLSSRHHSVLTQGVLIRTSRISWCFFFIKEAWFLHQSLQLQARGEFGTWHYLPPPWRSTCQILMSYKKTRLLINRKRMFLMLTSYNNHMMNRDLLKESLSSWAN